MAATLLATCGIGLGLGLRHALESDHVAAIGTLIASGQGPRRAATLGAAWGAGHALAVLGAGLVLLALGVRVPAGVAVALDLAVAAMLVLLGARSLTGRAHAHAGGTARVRTPLGAAVVGLVHGASGTAALTLLVLTTMPSRLQGAWFLGVFAAGATAGMTVLSALLAVPLGAAFAKWRAAARAVPWLAGALSLAAAAFIVLGAARGDAP